MTAPPITPDMLGDPVQDATGWLANSETVVNPQDIPVSVGLVRTSLDETTVAWPTTADALYADFATANVAGTVYASGLSLPDSTGAEEWLTESVWPVGQPVAPAP